MSGIRRDRTNSHHPGTKWKPINEGDSQVSTATKTITQLPTEPTKGRGRLQAVLGGLIAVVVVAAFWALWANNQATTPIDIANEYMEARNAFDAERADALMSADATLMDAPRMSRDELAQGFEALRVYDAQWEPFECNSKPGATLVTCDYSLETNLSRIVGHTPVTGSILFLVEQGQITSLVHNFNYDDYGTNVFEKFLTWLGTEHPGAIEQVYVERDGAMSPNLEPEALAQLKGYIEEYDLSVNG